MKIQSCQNFWYFSSISISMKRIDYLTRDYYDGFINDRVKYCSGKINAVKYVFSANTVLILIQYFLGQISVLNLTEFFIARN